MFNLVDQRSAIKFCLRNDISAAETYRMLQKDFGDDTMSQTKVFKWYRDLNAPDDHRVQLMTKTPTE